MISYSTPSSITVQMENGKKITFYGEWTLEPKFYCDDFVEKFWDKPYANQMLTATEVNQCKQVLLSEAKHKGWIIVF